MLDASDLTAVSELFCRCFFDDGYYGKMFPDPETRKNDMAVKFADNIKFCLGEKGCFGVFKEDALVAFILTFDYFKVLKNNETQFRRLFGYSGDSWRDNGLYKRVCALSDKVIFLLSVAVDESLRGMGIASALVDYVTAHFQGYAFAGDVSNTASLKIYERRGFVIDELEEDYHLVELGNKCEGHTFVCDETVKVLLPDTCVLDKNNIRFTVIKENYALCGCCVEHSGDIACFVEDGVSVTAGKLVQLGYKEYLEYQRIINVALFGERFSGECTFFVKEHDLPIYPLTNQLLDEMIPTREKEWGIIPDIFVSIPVQYNGCERLASVNARDEKTEHLLKMLEFRTNYELGIQTKTENVDELANCKNRIKRYYLGKFKVQISGEITLECYNAIGNSLGGESYLDLYISIDEGSDSAVLSWYSLATPFLVSHYLDNIIRNQLMVVTETGKMNIFDILNQRFGIVKKGTPKIFVVIPEERDALLPNQIASLIAAETIYPEGENFGGIIDKEILDIVNSETGMGQYDRAYVYAYTNVVIQFSPELKDTLMGRLNEESITQFYIELVLFQEAAIHIADRAIAKLFTTEKIHGPVDFLNKVDDIYDNYSKTIDFWDINVNYPTSQKSIDMLRKSFKVQEQLEYMMRNLNHLGMVFDTKCDLADRKESRRMDSSLAIISLLAIFSAWTDSFAFAQSLGKVISPAAVDILQKVLFVAILIVAVYAVVSLVGGRFNNLVDKRKKKRGKSK